MAHGGSRDGRPAIANRLGRAPACVDEKNNDNPITTHFDRRTVLPILALSLLPCGLDAQNRAPPRAALEEIVVTATRVETNLQETPMSIHAFSGEDLDLAGIDAGRDLGIMVPNVVINPGCCGEFATATFIRGLPGVTTYVDGINFYNVGFLQRSFVEIERVEVLRGPQGTLFGRNTNGGAVQILTRRAGRGVRAARLDVRARGVRSADALRSPWTCPSPIG